MPAYFRHNRFQSLVRQLNFYNFRKVNRERTFWVYRHPLFHRDKPQNLHLLRRRTCPGVDGRKHKPDYDIQTLETRENLEFPGQADLVGDVGRETHRIAKPRPKRSAAKRVKVAKKQIEEESVSGLDSDDLSTDDNSSRSRREIQDIVEASHLVISSKSTSSTKKNQEEDSLSEKELAKRARTERHEQSIMVSHVAQRLEEFAKRAEGESGNGGRRGRAFGRGGIVTPPVSRALSDTMKYHALTYDDEGSITVDPEDEAFEGRNSRIGHSKKNNIKSDDDENMDELDSKCFVTDDGESDGDSSGPSLSDSRKIDGNRSFASLKNLHFKSFQEAPLKDLDVIAEITNKLRVNNEALAVVAMFCMATAPRDENIDRKAMQVISSCSQLEDEFERYRSALRPNIGNIRGLIVSEYVQDFKYFSVNYLQKFLIENQKQQDSYVSVNQVSAIQVSTSLWAESLVY